MKLKQNILIQKEKLKLTDNERWLSDGDCGKCRRANYCQKDCSARKKHKNAIIQKAFMDVMEKYNPGYKELIEKIELN